MHLNPAEYVIFIFGGVRATARQLGRSPGTVSLWMKAIEDKGRGGYVPFAAQRIILQIALEQGLDIKPNDFHYGREVEG